MLAFIPFLFFAMATNEIMSAITEIRNVLNTMNGSINGLMQAHTTSETRLNGLMHAQTASETRLATLQQNGVDVDGRLTSHEGVHDPHLVVIDAIRQQVDNLGPQLTIVDGRITSLTQEMNDCGLTQGTAARIGAVETQVTAVASNMALSLIHI